MNSAKATVMSFLVAIIAVSPLQSSEGKILTYNVFTIVLFISKLVKYAGEVRLEHISPSESFRKVLKTIFKITKKKKINYYIFVILFKSTPFPPRNCSTEYVPVYLHKVVVFNITFRLYSMFGSVLIHRSLCSRASSICLCEKVRVYFVCETNF